MRTGRFSVGKGNILLAIDAEAKEIAGKIGETFDIEVVPERDMYFHRRMFATIGELADAIGQDPEWLRHQLLVYTGNFHIVGTLDGKHVISVKSMSRKSMTDADLHRFWEKAKAPIEARVLPLIQNETLRDQIRASITAF